MVFVWLLLSVYRWELCGLKLKSWLVFVVVEFIQIGALRAQIEELTGSLARREEAAAHLAFHAVFILWLYSVFIVAIINNKIITRIVYFIFICAFWF